MTATDKSAVTRHRNRSMSVRNEEYMYDDIINLEHHKSKTRKHMPIADRAAQFAPFAALTGHDAAISETARLTGKRIELDEYSKEELNQKLLFIHSCIDDGVAAAFTYFEPDEKKSGGKYVTASGLVKKIKEFEKVVIMDDGLEIPVDDIIMIESDIFNVMDEI